MFKESVTLMTYDCKKAPCLLYPQASIPFHVYSPCESATNFHPS